MLSFAADRWHWLSELVERCTSRPTPASPRPKPVSNAALGHALCELGLSDAELVEGVASVLHMRPEQWTRPDASQLAKVDPYLLGALLPALFDHPSEVLRRAGQSWLELPQCLFHLPQEIVAQWALRSRYLPQIVLETLELRGLALVGPHWLDAIAHNAYDDRARQAAKRWLQRLRPVAFEAAKS